MSKKAKSRAPVLSPSPDLPDSGDTDDEFEQMMQTEHLQKMLQDQMADGNLTEGMTEALGAFTNQIQGIVWLKILIFLPNSCEKYCVSLSK
jgi:hypothetical protein